MSWEDLLLDSSDDDDESLDEELDILLVKIDEINASDEEGNQKESIELCDSALELAKVSQPDKDDLREILYWFTGANPVHLKRPCISYSVYTIYFNYRSCC
ncbi:MAG: hypothetical protein HN936_18720 [Bacteroidetes bacterium]|jgi:hypothetical protein|nr:hypothetical protein [Candidatus Neomarinimicrobiota bacterium]MBT6053742.1 hypothetical protein [Candidatus Scalindua sp.]MBT7095285.1 hypothetical protein [Bacteroidota bacterium]MBT7929391.1 hypothetical protein [Candidatus Peregrinibacteria bacterium]MBT5235509.1 hypothetical protein [Candidatus Neomarinimicrobiota bacterium]